MILAALIMFETCLAGLLNKRWGGRVLPFAGTPFPALAGWIIARQFEQPVMRHVIFAGMLFTILLQAFLLARTLEKKSGLCPWRLGVIVAIVLSCLATQHVFSPPFDDESMRFIAAISWLRDGDFELSDEYSSEAWTEFRNSRPSYFVDFARSARKALRADPGSFFPYHATGFTLLIAPGYGIGRLLGDPRWARLLAVVPVLLGASLLTALFASILFEQGYEARLASRASLLFSLAAPQLFFGIHVWPEMLAALAGVWAWRLMTRPATSRGSVAVIGAVTAFLPLLHFRYIFLSIPLALATAYVWRRRPVHIVAFCAGGFLPALGLALNMAVRNDAHTWRILWKIQYAFPAAMGLKDFLMARLFDAHLMWERIGDSPAGFLPYVPVMALVASAGLRGRWLALFLASGTIFSTLVYALSSGPLARYWVPVLPLMLIFTMPRTRPSRVWWGLAVLGAAKGIAITALPALCHDALMAHALAHRFPPYLEGFVRMLLG